MEIFVTNDELAVLEEFLPTLHNLERVTMLVNLAWHLRQRDTHRALILEEEARNLLAQLPDTIKATHSLEILLLRARMKLVRGESDWLFSNLEKAQKLGEKALLEFEQVSGSEGELGCADAHFLLANVAVHRGAMPLIESEIGKAIIYANNANDIVRETLMQSLLAVQTALRNLPLALKLWGDTFSLNASSNNAVITTCQYEFLMYTSTLSSDFRRAAEYGMQVVELALQTGQIRRAILAATLVPWQAPESPSYRYRNQRNGCCSFYPPTVYLSVRAFGLGCCWPVPLAAAFKAWDRSRSTSTTWNMPLTGAHRSVCSRWM